VKEREFRERLHRAAEGARASDEAFGALQRKYRRPGLQNRLSVSRRALVLVAAVIAMLAIGIGVRGAVCSDYKGTTALAGNGRYVAYVAKDGCGSKLQAFVHDRVTAQTTRVSRDPSGGRGNGSTFDVALSADGRHVAFSSAATNLVPGDLNNSRDVFVRDLDAHETVLVSVTSTGQQANGASSHPVLSADGRYVAFQSRATNLAPGDLNGGSDIFLHDILTGATSLVSVSLTGTPGNSYSLGPSISDDGHLIAFDSAASDLVPGDLNGKRDVFVRNTITHSTMRVSTDHGFELNADSYICDLSSDGGFIVFGSDAAIPAGSSFSSTAVTNPGPTHAYLVDLKSGELRGLGNFKAIDSVAVGIGADVVAVSSREKTAVIRVFFGPRVGSFDRMGFGISLTNDGRFISFTGGPGSNVAEGVIDWARSRVATSVTKW
jgi:hypothetical protein